MATPDEDAQRAQTFGDSIGCWSEVGSSLGMHEPLETLLADGVIEEICGRLKSGKEADLWLVRHGGEIVAAKVYKAREARSFRNNAGYKEGRQVRNTRTQRAMDRGSRFGQAAAEEAWKAKEADALHTLHAAGVRVPKPVLFYEGVLLMELVLDPHGRPAPRLVDAHVARDAAASLYSDLRGQAVRMLGCDLIHGDLSPYNILVGPHGPVVIDFPQVVGAAHNSQAESFFRRDLENLQHFFASIDPSLRASANDAREIWRAYVRRELTPDFVPSGKAAHPSPQKPRTAGATPQGPRTSGQPQRSRPHEGGAPGDRARPERSHHAPRTQPHDAKGGARGRHDSSVPARREPGGRPPDRRRTAPMPEVIRVVRSPLPAQAAPAAAPHPPHPPKPHGAPAAPPHPSHSATPPGAASQRADDGRSHHRRRRRRRR
jgi:RIO kinase 1